VPAMRLVRLVRGAFTGKVIQRWLRRGLLP